MKEQTDLPMLVLLKQRNGPDGKPLLVPDRYLRASDLPGQLGQGNTEHIADDAGETPVVVDLGPGRTATAITAGVAHTCASLDDGTARCWGWNAYGQLGAGSSQDYGDDPGETPVVLPPIDLGGELA